MDLDKMHPVKAGSSESLLLDNSILKPEPRDVDTIPSFAGSTTFEKPFRFLDLPPEIRNKVYQRPCIYTTCSRQYSCDCGWPLWFDGLQQAAITRVNKQIRSETLPIFYGNHRFAIEIPVLPQYWQHRGPHKGSQDPVELIKERLNALTPDPDSNLQANSLRFLSKLTLDVGLDEDIDLWEDWSLIGLGVAMSSKELDCDHDEEQLMGTKNLDWKECAQVRVAYVSAVESCRLIHDGLLDVSGVGCDEVDEVASALAALMCHIAKLCPQLTSNVSALLSLREGMYSHLFRARGTQDESEEESSTDGDESEEWYSTDGDE